jgi:competence protein ComEA
MRALLFAVGVLFAALSVSTPAAYAQEKSAKPKASASVATPVNLNTATAAQLEKLPGIGARTAQLIVEHRQKNGNFKKVEELMNIKGIGEKSFLKLKPLVTVTVKADKPTGLR